MSVEVVMPQMGESITEGTVSKWLKAVGDKIEKDEPILEISTDKVDAEVPSPAAGTLLEIRHQEGETVEVGTALAIIGAEGEEPAGSGQKAEGSAPAEAPTPEILAPKADEAKAASATAAATTNPKPEIPNPTAEATPIVMPQMGESITEGTVSKWLKAVGDNIEKDEPLLEISTDKVDAEVPSPAAGKLLEIKVSEGETVEVGAVLALVGSEGAAPVGGGQKAEGSLSSTPVAQAAAASASPSASAPQPPARATPQSAIRNPQLRSNGDVSVEELRRTKSSPLVRKIAQEHGIDITRIEGSGISGRVTKDDIMSFIETGAALRPQDLLRKDAPTAPAISTPAAKPSTYAPATITTSAEDRVEKMSVMRDGRAMR